MLTGQKSIKSRTRPARRKQNKFVTPDLVLSAGKLRRFVAGPDDPLREAERLRGQFAQMVAHHHAEVGQFLQQAYGVALQFRRRPRDFERLQVHPFWKQTGQKKPQDPSSSKWVLYLIMQAATTDMCHRADRYAVILDGLLQDQVEISAVAARIQELGGIGAAYEALRLQKREDAQISGTVAETAAAGRRTRRDDERSPRQIGASVTPTKRPRRRRPQYAFPHPSLPNLFARDSSNPDLVGGDSSSPAPLPKIEFMRGEWVAVEEIEEGVWAGERVPAESAFDFVQRLAGEYGKIKDGDHKSVRRVLQRAYLAARKMQREPDEFKRLQDDPFFGNASFHEPKDPSTSKWVLYFIMQAGTLNVRILAGKYAAILDRLMGDDVSPDDLRIAQVEGVEAAYAAVQARPRLRGSKLWSRQQGGNE